MCSCKGYEPGHIARRGREYVFASRQGAADSDGEREELPNTARTSLSSFKFDRKGVKPMTPTMCRKLIATLYMVRHPIPVSEGLHALIMDEYV